MASERRTILTVMLDHTLPSSTSSQNPFGDMDKSQIQRMVADAHEKVRQAGFDSDTIELNPHDHDASITRLAEKLQSWDYDALQVGFGLRGNREVTPLFEAVVQKWREVAPQKTRIMFGNSPVDVMVTLRRNFPNLVEM